MRIKHLHRIVVRHPTLLYDHTLHSDLCGSGRHHARVIGLHALPSVRQLRSFRVLKEELEDAPLDF